MSGEEIAEHGRVVVLAEERWAHVIRRHPELAPFREQVLEVTRIPTRRVAGRRPGEEWLYGPGGPSQWLKVVVHWEGTTGSIVTAFARRSFP